MLHNMNELPSAQFRKVYRSLRAPVTVTVNGHPIGTYQPIMSSIDSRTVEAIRPGEPRSNQTVQAFRPVPKPSQRGKS